MAKYDISNSDLIKTFQMVYKQTVSGEGWSDDGDLTWVFTKTRSIYRTKDGKYFEYVVEECVPEQDKYSFLATKKEYKKVVKSPEL